jgi:hypothetical protein
MPAAVHVYISYPADTHGEDETWLEAVTSKHHGDLAEERLATSPMQGSATFRAAWEAAAFVSELTASGRWTAQTI